MAKVFLDAGLGGSRRAETLSGTYQVLNGVLHGDRGDLAFSLDSGNRIAEVFLKRIQALAIKAGEVIVTDPPRLSFSCENAPAPFQHGLTS